MRIQHNISALNAHRQLGTNNNAVAKNLEKLSSGFRINRAGDDAAGLAISEKMRGQIRGLEMASKNAQDGVSLIQTAEGALQETHSILQRMRELSVQASNGTYEEGFDSKQINKEVNHLKDEIDRISSSTHFNNKKLLNGDLAAGSTGGGSTVTKADSNIKLDDTMMGSWSVTAAVNGKYTSDKGMESISKGSTQKFTFNYKDESGTSQTLDIDLSFDGDKITSSNGASVSSAAGAASDVATALKAALEKNGDFNDQFKVTVDAATNKLEFEAKTAGTSGASISGFSKTTTGVTSKITASHDGAGNVTLDFSNVDLSKIKAGDSITIGGQKIDFVAPTAGKVAHEAGKIYMDVWEKAGGSLDKLLDGIVIAANGKVDGDVGAGTGTADQVAVAKAGNTLTATFTGDAWTKGGAIADAALDTFVANIKSTVGGIDYTNGQVGPSESTTTNKTIGTTTVATNKSQEVNLTDIEAWDADAANDDINKHVIDVNGKKFLFVKDDTADNKNMNEALKKLGSDVEVIKTKNVAINNTDAANMADRIAEKTGTDVTAGLNAAGDAVLNFKSPSGASSSGSNGGGITFQIGANGTKDDRVSLSVAKQDTKTLGIAKIDLSTAEGANNAITLLDNAINSVSSTRADLGALQNRLEHTINNLGTSVENLTASESRIRDVDMAKEMMEMTKNNILTQAAQAMLAQANTQPQGVLQLLQ